MEWLPVVNYFRNLAAIMILVGALLFVLSFIFNLSIWFGIELIKGGFFLFMIGLFIQVLEPYSSKRGTERVS